MPARLADVAAMAKVSVSTVSRVINNKDRVDDKTREKVMEAVKVLHFYPNDLARSLRSNSAKTVAMVVPDLSNYFYASVIKGVESVLHKKGYSIIVCNSNEDAETEAQYTQMLLQKRIAGLLIAPVDGCGFYQQYMNEDVPVVFFDNNPEIEQSFDFVCIDNIKASRDLTEFLIGLGHKKIAFLAGPESESSARERLQGWREAMEKADLQEGRSHSGKFTIDSGVRLMRKILTQPNRPTAILAANNFLAYGAIKTILDEGLRIPEDISVACFDAIDHTGLMRPQITTLIQPSEEIGTVAGELIIKKIENSKIKMFQRIMLEPKFVIRESTANI